MIRQIPTRVLDEECRDDSQYTKGDTRPEDALEGVSVGFPEGPGGRVFDRGGDAPDGRKRIWYTDGVVHGRRDQCTGVVEVVGDCDGRDPFRNLFALDAVEDGVEHGVAHAAASGSERADQARSETQMAEWHVETGNHVAEQRDQRKGPLAEELKGRPARAAIGDDSGVRRGEDGLDGQHHNDLEFQVADVTHRDGREAAKNDLCDAVGECNHADLDRVVREHVLRPLREEAGK